MLDEIFRYKRVLVESIKLVVDLSLHIHQLIALGEIWCMGVKNLSFWAYVNLYKVCNDLLSNNACDIKENININTIRHYIDLLFTRFTITFR